MCIVIVILLLLLLPFNIASVRVGPEKRRNGVNECMHFYKGLL